MFLARSMRAGVLVVVAVSLPPPRRYAQADRGTITGEVTDQSAAVIRGATVKAVHVATNFERQVTTSDEGSYTIPQLPVGGYVVIVTASRLSDDDAREHRGDGGRYGPGGRAACRRRAAGRGDRDLRRHGRSRRTA